VKVGIPREVKRHEYRVAATPAGVHELVAHGHDVYVEQGAGVGSSIPDAEYVGAGAKILESAEDVWGEADLVLKVKEPVEEEWPRMRRGQVLFTYLHLAASRPCTEALMASGTTAIAYETVQVASGALPLLAPMSEVAGRMATQVGAHFLEREAGGRGILLGGVPGVPAAQVLVLGAGVSGMSAATIAVGMGADVTLADRDVQKLRDADRHFDGRLKTLMSTAYAVERAAANADLVIGAVLVPGAAAPKIVTDPMVAAMRPGSVLVDIAIDQGGCFEGSHPTTHDDPVFPVHNSLFYCVANMPGAVPNTSTYALTNVTLPYAVALADSGWRAAVDADPALRRGVNVVDGAVVQPAVAAAHGLPVGSVEG